MTSTGRRTRVVGALALALLCAACGGLRGSGDDPGTSAGASCVAPYLDDQPPGGPFRAHAPTVGPGDSLAVYGHWYTTTCNDAGQQDPLEPLPAVHLTLTLPGGAVEPLGQFAPAGQDMGFSAPVHVPEGASEGTAKVQDDGEFPATFTFEIRK